MSEHPYCMRPRREFWNLHVSGQWYCYRNPLLDQERVTSPHDKATIHTIKQMWDRSHALDSYEKIPFPNPLHHETECAYTVDQDSQIFILSVWDMSDGIFGPVVMKFDHTNLHELTRFSINSLIQRWRSPINHDSTIPSVLELLDFGPLNIDFGIPTSTNSRNYCSKVLFGHGEPISMIPYSGTIIFLLSGYFAWSFLRLASWDFKVTSSYEVPWDDSYLRHSSTAKWKYPVADIFWFHGFLVVLQENDNSEALISKAILRAKSYLADSPALHGVVLSILMSPRHIVFAEISQDKIACPASMPLLSSFSGYQCSPGFRVLSRVLSSECWKE
ncbi:hypothetical protein F5884DRAFT_279014 [Xylogone sp. PMI_703]|nr:hypothetical protein F5884DRAFT_279014 [Xylogone sp. PMI_703]